MGVKLKPANSVSDLTVASRRVAADRSLIS